MRRAGPDRRTRRAPQRALAEPVAQHRDIAALEIGPSRSRSEADVPEPVVVGHSMAGGIASMYAARHPVSGVVNVDALPVIAPFVRLISR